MTSAGEVPNSITIPALINMKIESEDFKNRLAYVLAQTQDPEEAMRLLDNIHTLETLNALGARGISAVPLFHESSHFYNFLPEGESSALEIVISKIPVIDESKLSWEQVMEVREDSKSQNSLRRFRVFLANNYSDKTPEYVKDSILKLLDDYEAACQKHGLELASSTLKNVLNSKSLLSTLSIGAAALLLGQPGVAAASLLAGSAIEIGKASIDIAEKNVNFLSSQSANEVAYLATLKSKLGE